jgi:hypothetical protein
MSPRRLQPISVIRFDGNCVAGGKNGFSDGSHFEIVGSDLREVAGDDGISGYSGV